MTSSEARVRELERKVNLLQQLVREMAQKILALQQGLRAADNQQAQQPSNSSNTVLAIRNSTDLAANSSGNIEILTPSLSGTGINITGVNLAGSAVTHGKTLVATWIQGNWVIIFEDCG